jgi:D-xylonolactonase
MNFPIECVVDLQNKCGESPLWDFRRARLVWNDLASNLVFEHDPATRETSVISRELMVAAIALNGENGFVFAGETGLHLWQAGSTPSLLCDTHDGNALVFNDILAAPNGGLFGNTAYWGERAMERTGHLYYFSPDGQTRILDEGFELANGMGLSLDNRVLYLADSARRVIYAYDVNSDFSVSNRRVFATVSDEEGLPDGLTVDAAGFVWSAQWYGAQVVRYDPDGKIERRIPMPAKQVSSVQFGGEELCDLYITTAGESWPSALMPPRYDATSGDFGGALYRVRTDILGRRENVCALRAPKVLAENAEEKRW